MSEGGLGGSKIIERVAALERDVDHLKSEISNLKSSNEKEWQNFKAYCKEERGETKEAIIALSSKVDKIMNNEIHMILKKLDALEGRSTYKMSAKQKIAITVAIVTAAATIIQKIAEIILTIFH